MPTSSRAAERETAEREAAERETAGAAADNAGPDTGPVTAPDTGADIADAPIGDATGPTISVATQVKKAQITRRLATFPRLLHWSLSTRTPFPQRSPGV